MICEVYQEVSIAIEDKIISDATGRNALYKIHVSLGKIVNNLTDKGAKGRKSSLPLEGKIVLCEEEEAEEKTDIMKTEGEDEGAVLGEVNEDESKLTRDSLVEDLLSDEDITMT